MLFGAFLGDGREMGEDVLKVGFAEGGFLVSCALAKGDANLEFVICLPTRLDSLEQIATRKRSEMKD